MTTTYQSGPCTIVTLNETTHELWYTNSTHGTVDYIATFKQFRDAVRYQLNEFP